MKDAKERPRDSQPVDLDARLARLLAETPRGVELSYREIGAAVGCSWQHIWYVEQQAMKKLRQNAALMECL